MTYLYHKLYNRFGFGGIMLLAFSFLSVLLGIIITIIFLYKISLVFSVINSDDTINKEATSMVGDFLGGVVGPIWSLASVFLFFLALRLQSKELGLQIKELKDTREVFLNQQFENTFFNLLKNQQDIKQGMECDEVGKNTPKHYKSHLVFDYLKTYMIEEYKTVSDKYLEIKKIDKIPKRNRESKHNRLREINITELKGLWGVEDYETLSSPIILAKVVYRKVFNNFHNQLGHYLRNLYHILSYLAENEERERFMVAYNEFKGESIRLTINDKSTEEKIIKEKYKKYSEFIQAQMSASELFLCFYNGLFFEKTKKLIHHFDFLENLSADDLLNPNEDINFYDSCTIDNKTMEKVTFKSRVDILKM